MRHRLIFIKKLENDGFMIRCDNCGMTVALSGNPSEWMTNPLVGKEIKMPKWFDLMFPTTCELWRMRMALR